MIAKSHRWRQTVIAAAATALFGLVGSNASALSLGRVTVQSALGEPLRAEIDIPEINAEEAASLKATVAPPAAFEAAGLEYNPAMANLRTTLQTRANGRAYLRLSSDRAINEPFVDMILEANWSSGRIVRDYTMLFDPPALKPASAAPTAVQVPAPAASAPVSRAATPAPVRAPAIVAQSIAPPKTMARPAERPEPSKSVESDDAKRSAQKISVKPGDTAGRIASAIKPTSVSLDQMLLALLRANPDAFIRDNVNRIKAGAVLTVPTEAQAAATSEAEASQLIIAQSKDFNDYRRRLAGSAPSTPQAPADRQASGRVQTQVEDKQSAATTPDKLTLSKGSVQGKLDEEQLAKDRNAADAASRAAELAKNISDLGKLGAASTTVAPPVSAPANEAPALAQVTATPAPVASEAPPPVAPASPVVAAPKPPVVEPTPSTEPSLIDEFVENPLVPAGAVGLIALLAGLGLYRMRQRRSKAQVDSSFMESHLKPESFFGASGGQSIDTNDSAATGSSMVYSPSQLVADDVDPVAEADVYLAYGRDLQAEEILREALRTHPGRIAIHQKLVEIFAKRNDAHSLEEIAALGFQMTGGTGPEWERICELGLSIDPVNSLYQPGGRPQGSDAAVAAPEPQATGSADDAPAMADDRSAPAASTGVDLDLDLDFSFDDEPVSQITEATSSPLAPELDSSDAKADESDSALTLEFDLPTEMLTPATSAPKELEPGTIEFSLLDEPPDEKSAETSDEAPAQVPEIDSEDFKKQAATSFGTTAPVELNASETEEDRATDLSMLDFDLGSISLDLEQSAAPDANAAPIEHDDPLMTKLALAEEFSAIGDDDGARALIEEVISEATGEMKVKAQRALSKL